MLEAVTRTMAGNRSPYTVLGKTYHVLATEQGYSERGVASWYGEKFHGHKTSNGEIFDMGGDLESGATGGYVSTWSSHTLYRT